MQAMMAAACIGHSVASGVTFYIGWLARPADEEYWRHISQTSDEQTGILALT